MSDQELNSLPLLVPASPPLSPTVSTADYTLSTASHGVIMPPRLPTYKEFLNNLVEVPRGAISRDEQCPICRVPFGEVPETAPELEDENLILLNALPFAIEVPFDRPVRLPCKFGHLMGDACVKWSFESRGSNTCPLDREELFERGTNYKQVEGVGNKLWQLTNGPLRALLTDWKEWKDDDRIIVNLKWKNTAWARSLAAIMLRVACRLTKTSEVILLEVWQKIKYSINGGTSEHLQHHDFPTCLGIGNNGDLKPFRQLIRHIAACVGLNENGRFPQWLDIMLDKKAEMMFLAVQNGLTALNKPGKYNKPLLAVTPTVLGRRLLAYTHYRWYKAGLVAKEGGPEDWHRFANLVIVAWIGAERLLGKLKNELSSTDEYQHFIIGNDGDPMALSDEFIAVLDADLINEISPSEDIYIKKCHLS